MIDAQIISARAIDKSIARAEDEFEVSQAVIVSGVAALVVGWRRLTFNKVTSEQCVKRHSKAENLH